jgi:hypothetical protein
VEIAVLAASVAAIAGFVGSWAQRQVRRAQRGDFIRRYMFPPGLLGKLRQRYPHFRAREEQYTARALRRFFLTYLHAGFAPVAMPSQAADELWHEFILHTRHYERFCRQAFGRFLHHAPVAVMAPHARARNAALRRTWWHACLDENIDPRKPTRLPLLFALDAKLAIAGGYRYRLDGALAPPQERDPGFDFDVSVFTDPGVDGGTEGFGADGGDGAGGDSGCGGGCGGD